VNSVVDGRTHLEVLDRAECLRLLAGTHLGRLAVVVDERPLVFPVNYALDGDAVVFRTAEGTKLHGARGHEVAFEIDRFDAAYHTGWSVLVVGVGEELDAPADIERCSRLPLRPWGEAPKAHWMRIRPRAITGRRIPPHGIPSHTIASVQEETQ